MEEQNNEGAIVKEGSADLKEQIKDLGKQAEFPQAPVPENFSVATEEIKYAGFWVRFVAALIDGFVLLIPNFILGFLTSFYVGKNAIISNVMRMFLTWAYYIWMTNKDRATIGKKVMGLEVRSDSVEDLTLNQIILRETVGKLISYVILGIGYIMAGFTAKKQALHDMIAKTVVVYRNPR